MKKTILSLTLILVSLSSAFSQFTLEHIYDTASATSFYFNKFQHNGEKYIHIRYPEKPLPQMALPYEMRIYNLNHSIWKTIDLSNLPRPTGNSGAGARYYFLYVSDSLFDPDNLVEFMYSTIKFDTLSNATDPLSRLETFIYNENQAILFNDTSGPFYTHVNIPQTQVPIVNTSMGAKMMLATSFGSMKVFSLPGLLSNSVQNHTENFNDRTFIYPNPSLGQAVIDYNLPVGTTEATVVIYSLSGQTIKKYAIDNNFKNLIISTADLPSGTYFYAIETKEHKMIQGKKFVTLGN